MEKVPKKGREGQTNQTLSQLEADQYWYVRGRYQWPYGQVPVSSARYLVHGTQLLLVTSAWYLVFGIQHLPEPELVVNLTLCTENCQRKLVLVSLLVCIVKHIIFLWQFSVCLVPAHTLFSPLFKRVQVTAGWGQSLVRLPRS